MRISLSIIASILCIMIYLAINTNPDLLYPFEKLGITYISKLQTINTIVGIRG